MIQPLSAIKRVRLEFPHLRVAYLVPFADLHIGSPYCREAAIKGYVKWVQEKPNAYAVGLGDWHQNNVVGNKASNVYEQTVRPQDQPTRSTELMSPISDRFWGAIGGGHDLRGAKTTDQDLMRQAAQKLGIEDRYSPDGLFISVLIGQVEYSLYMVHGWGGARTSGGQVNKIEELGKVVTAEVYLCGHEHTLTYSRGNRRYVQDGLEKNVRQHFIGCGCFEDYTGFLVGISRKAPDIGSPRIRFDGQRRDIHVSF